MAKVSTRRRRTAPRSRRNGIGRRALRLIISGLFLRAVLFGLIIGVILSFHEPIVKEILRSLGLAIIPVLLWIVVTAWMLWRGRFGSLLRHWNSWLGALLLSAAVIGVMALFRPAVEIAGVSLREVTLTGFLGQVIAGTSYEWARLLGLGLLGVILVTPGRSFNLARALAGFAWMLVLNLLILLGTGFWHLVQKFLSGLLSLAGLLKIKIATLFEAKPVAPRPPRSQEVARETEPVEPATTEPESSEATLGLAEQPVAEDVMLPGIDGELPAIQLLDEAPKASFARGNDAERAELIEEALASYGVEVKVVQVNPGPSVTQFGIEPGWIRRYRRVVEKDQNGKPKLDKNGNPRAHLEEVSKTRVKVDRITSLANDLALALAVTHVRIEAPVPGKPLVGIEVPNISTALVSLRHVIESPVFDKARIKSRLLVALGQGAAGEAVVADIAKMPHILIAGATGSGKTVCLNCIVTGLLMQATPAEVRLVLIDPKRVEMITFNGIPHLLTPVVVETDKAVDTLRRVTLEMDHRYRKFASLGVRNIDTYNRNPNVAEPLPYIVVIIDELADLMMTAPDVVEPLICRLAQLSRATGIHLVVATQRPSVDVITGLIKANFPTRISFAVVSSIDSRTILDSIGAEKLLGRGDMLYLSPEAHKPKRLRGCFVSDDEMDRAVAFWRKWGEQHFPQSLDRVAQQFSALSVEQLDLDPFLEKARQLCEESGSISASLLQRRLHIGYPRAARIMEQLEEEGLVESREYAKPWEGEP
ncbi:FtsK/SpoIIIE domain-containing protein [Dehalococcoidia bacterium]|nr:FtsK/SpoIIIE domain-containing protein [Dehalococcoidia bacterium]